MNKEELEYIFKNAEEENAFSEALNQYELLNDEVVSREILLLWSINNKNNNHAFNFSLSLFTKEEVERVNMFILVRELFNANHWEDKLDILGKNDFFNHISNPDPQKLVEKFLVINSETSRFADKLISVGYPNKFEGSPLIRNLQNDGDFNELTSFLNKGYVLSIKDYLQNSSVLNFKEKMQVNDYLIFAQKMLLVCENAEETQKEELVNDVFATLFNSSAINKTEFMEILSDKNNILSAYINHTLPVKFYTKTVDSNEAECIFEDREKLLYLLNGIKNQDNEKLKEIVYSVLVKKIITRSEDENFNYIKENVSELNSYILKDVHSLITPTMIKGSLTGLNYLEELNKNWRSDYPMEAELVTWRYFRENISGKTKEYIKNQEKFMRKAFLHPDIINKTFEASVSVNPSVYNETQETLFTVIAYLKNHNLLKEIIMTEGFDPGLNIYHLLNGINNDTKEKRTTLLENLKPEMAFINQLDIEYIAENYLSKEIIKVINAEYEKNSLNNTINAQSLNIQKIRL